MTIKDIEQGVYSISVKDFSCATTGSKGIPLSDFLIPEPKPDTGILYTFKNGVRVHLSEGDNTSSAEHLVYFNQDGALISQYNPKLDLTCTAVLKF